MQIRPPLLEALQKDFGMLGDKLPVYASSTQLKAADGVHITLYQTINMLEPDVGAGIAAKLIGYAHIKDNSETLHSPGRATTVNGARWFIHGANVEEALRVLVDRCMKSRIHDGSAGEGVYGSAMPDGEDENESILQAWTSLRQSKNALTLPSFSRQPASLSIPVKAGFCLQVRLNKKKVWC